MTVTPGSGSRRRFRNPFQAAPPALRTSSPHPPVRRASSPRAVQGAMERVVHGVTANSKVHPRRQESPPAAQETNSRGRGFVQHSKVNPNPIFFQCSRFAAVCGVEDAHPGARASRPHKVRHSLGSLRHSDRPETAPWLSVWPLRLPPTGRLPSAPGESSATAQGIRHKDAGGTPALPGGRPWGGLCRSEFCKSITPPLRGSRRSSRMAKADPVGGSHKASQRRDLVRRRGFAQANLRAKADAVGGRTPGRQAAANVRVRISVCEAAHSG